MKVRTFFVNREVVDPQIFKATANESRKGCYGVIDGDTDELLFWCGSKLSAHIATLNGDMAKTLAFLLNCRVERQDEGNWVAMMPADNGATSLGLNIDELIEEERRRAEAKAARFKLRNGDDDSLTTGFN